MSNLRFHAIKNINQHVDVNPDLGNKVSDYYGENVFTEDAMRQHLPGDVFKSVKNAVYSKSGKEVTKKTYEDIIKDIIGKIGYGSYYTNGWEDATTHREVKENFITFCNNLMRDIKDLYNTVVKQTGCHEVLHFGTLSLVGKSTKHSIRASIGGKSRKKNKPKRKSRKSKSKKIKI